MDNIIVGNPGDDNYVLIGTLSNGLPVYRYISPSPRVIDEQLIERYNKSTEISDTKTINLLEKFYADEAKEHEKELLREQIRGSSAPDQQPTAPTSSKYTDPILKIQTDANMYLKGIKKLEKKEKKKIPRKPHIDPPKSPPIKRKSKPIQQQEEYSSKTDHYTEHFKKDNIIDEPAFEPINEEIEPKADSSLLDAYSVAKQKEKNVEQKLQQEKSKSIADFYEKLKDGKQSSELGDKEVLGYMDGPDDVQLPVTENTTEYLDLFYRDEEKEKDIQTDVPDVHGSIEEEEDKQDSLVTETSSETTKLDVDVNEYVPDDPDGIVARKDTDKTTISELYDSVKDTDPVEESIAVPIIDYYKKAQQSESEDTTSRYYDKPEIEEQEIEIDPEEYVKTFDNPHDDAGQVRVDLTKDYFKELYNVVTDRDNYESEMLYEQSQRDIEQKKIKRESAAHLYLDHIRKLSQEQQKLLSEHEEIIAGQKLRTKERYEELLVLVNQKTDNIYDEVGDYSFDIDIFEKTITVTNTNTDSSNIFVFEGTLREYNVDGNNLKLYSTQTEDTDIKHDPGLYVTHHYTTYNLETSQLLKNDSFTLVKLEESAKRMGTRAPAAPGISSTTGGGKPAGDGPHPGIVTFTTGYGYSDSFDGWSGAHSPPSTLSAIAPDGWERGRVKIGVERKQIGARKATGALTIRYLITPQKPDFALDDDYTIDWDAAQNDGEHGDEATGSGAYNYSYQSLDSEVAFSSGGGLTYETDPLSGEVQTITWADGELGVKYIDIYHSKIGTASNKQNTNRWYAVYLTTDQSYAMGVSATPGSKGPGNTRTPSSSALIAPYTSEFATERGNITSPFFVAISGWSLGQADSIYG